MNENQLIEIITQALYVIIKSSAPMLLISLVVGLLISILQTITSIQEQTLTFVPKLLAIFIILIICGNWVLNNVVEFMETLYGSFSMYTNP